MISPKAIIATIRVNILRRPLWREALVMTCLQINRWKLLKMIDCGELPWAWDISLDGRKKEVRVLAYSVLEREAGPMGGIGRSKNLKLPEVLSLIGVPEQRQALKGTELQRLLWCGPDMVRELGQAGELDIIPGSEPKRGKTASPRFTRSSVVRFLEVRRMI